MKVHVGNTLLRLGTASAKPGRRSWGQLHVREGRKQVSLPVCVLHGARPGRHVVVVANQHGQEVNGIEAVRRFCEEIDPMKLRGTVFAIPLMNPIATMNQSQTWNEGDKVRAGDHYCNQYNMNHLWPGKKSGLLVERVAYEVWHRAIDSPSRKADLVIDIHCHQRQSSVYANGLESMRLAFPTGLRYIHLQESSMGGPPSLPQLCDRNDIPNITVELQTQRIFNRESIAEGSRLIRNLLKFWGMIDGKLELPREMYVIDPWGVTKTRSWRGKTYVEICAHHHGIVIPHKISQERICKGELVCEVIDPHTGRVIQSVRAPKAGYLHMVLDYEPVVKKGQRLCLIALITKVVNPAREMCRTSPSVADRKSNVK